MRRQSLREGAKNQIAQINGTSATQQRSPQPNGGKHKPSRTPLNTDRSHGKLRDMWEEIKINPIRHDTHILKKKIPAGNLRYRDFSFAGIQSVGHSTEFQVMAALRILLILAVFAFVKANAFAAASSDFEKMALALREKAILKVEPPVVSSPSSTVSSRYQWKRDIVTTVFWVGERPTRNNPVPNNKSSWDPQWHRSFGGFDDPDPSARNGWIPKRFTPRQNPFYVALPYNDVTKGRTKPESEGIPWFRDAFEKAGKSVCKGRWVAIQHGRRVAYAQWEDCGPFRTDHFNYVFGKEKPRPNLNQGAGLDVSPAIRDYLGMAGKDVCDWKFVDARDVPEGPWTRYGDNNTFVLQRLGKNLNVVDRNNARSASRSYR